MLRRLAEDASMSVFRKAMVYLGLVDDDEYYGDDGGYYEDEVTTSPIARPQRPSDRDDRHERHERSTRAAAPAAGEPSPVTVIRSRRERDEPAPAAATSPRPSAVHRGTDARDTRARDGARGLQRRPGGRRPAEGRASP